MKDDAIGRQATIDALNIPDYENGEAYTQYEQDVNVIRKMPPIEPEQKIGEWNKISDDTFHCLRCGITFTVIQGNSHMHYCPNCGAKMEVRIDDGK